MGYNADIVTFSGYAGLGFYYQVNGYMADRQFALYLGGYFSPLGEGQFFRHANEKIPVAVFTGHAGSLASKKYYF